MTKAYRHFVSIGLSEGDKASRSITCVLPASDEARGHQCAWSAPCERPRAMAMATQMLRQQHRHIEQALAIIEAQVEDCERDFEALVVDLAAHLAAEESVFYPGAEKALGRPLAEQRKHHELVRDAVTKAARATRDAARFPGLLFELTEAFKAHARAEERAVHPSLEGVLGGRNLEALGCEVAAFYTAVAAAIRGVAASSGQDGR